MSVHITWDLDRRDVLYSQLPGLDFNMAQVGFPVDLGISPGYLPVRYLQRLDDTGISSQYLGLQRKRLSQTTLSSSV